MRLPSSTWIGVFAHPDDEWIAGWPVFQDRGATKGIVFVAGDNLPSGSENPKVRRRALGRVLTALDVRFLGCLGLPPDFYRAARTTLRRLPERLAGLLGRSLPEEFRHAALITHNPYGEYGHPDHRVVFESLLEASPAEPCYVTDQADREELPAMHRRLFFQGPAFGPFRLDRVRWRQAKSCYESGYGWTGRSLPVACEARLYRL